MAAAPIMPMMIGAGIGAATSDNPLKGALLGGALGGVGGGMMGIGGMGANAGAQGLASAAGTGLSSAAAGSQAAMLAAQNAGMGLGADMATKAALAANTGSMISPFYGGMASMSNMFSGMHGSPSNLISAGQNISKMGERPQAPPPVVAPPPQMNPNAGGSFTSPYDPSRIGANPYSSMFSQPTILPGFRR